MDSPITKLSKFEQSQLKTLGWGNIHSQRKDEAEVKWKRRLFKLSLQGNRAQTLLFKGPTDSKPASKFDLVDCELINL